MKLIYQLRLLWLALGALGFAAVSVMAMKPRIEEVHPLLPPPQSPFPTRVAGVGLVEPRSETLAIGNPVAGLIKEVAVRAGDWVEAGDLLYALETKHLEADFAVQEAQAAETEAALGDAKMKLSLLEAIKDPRAVSKEELETRRFTVQQAESALQREKAEVARIRTEIERQQVRSPIRGEILRVEARPGEFAPATRLDEALVLLGDTSNLRVRAEFPEEMGWKIRAENPAKAFARGRGGEEIALRYVRREPYVQPKRSLTGNPDERVDTRVVQVVYEFESPAEGVLIGQQVDVFVEAPSEN